MSQQLGQWGTIAGIKSIGVRSGLWLASFCLLSGVAARGQTLNLETPVVPDRLPTANVMSGGAPLASGYASSPAPIVGTATMAGHVASGPYASGPMVSGPMVEGPMVTDCNQCGGGGCDTCSTFGGPTLGLTPGGTGVWFRADYLIWWERDAKLPPLVSTSNGTPAADNIGVIGQPNTQVLFGYGVDDNPLNGYRIELGMQASDTYGIFGRFLQLEDREINFSAGPGDFAFLALPFNNLAVGEDAFLLTVPGERTGSVDVDLDGDFSSWEILMTRCAQTGCNYRIDYVFGYRNFRLDERLRLGARTEVLAGSPVGIAGEVITTTDLFDVENEFHGLDLGLRGHSRQGNWSLDFMTKVALGSMQERLEISGSQTTTVPGVPSETLVGGLFSQESNIGIYEDDRFAWIPELNVNVGYAISPSLDFLFGYSLIYLSDVWRAGTAIDRSIDPAFLGDLEPLIDDRPRAMTDESDFWLQGINFGLSGRF